MSFNKYKPHVLILPEDAANEEIANGFFLHLAVRPQQAQILPIAGGWLKALEKLKAGGDYASLANNPRCHVIVLIDCDDFANRAQVAQQMISPHFANRVFILGASKDPETLKRTLRLSLEDIGHTLADDCAQPNLDNLWSHPMLQHNHGELQRLLPTVRSILF